MLYVKPFIIWLTNWLWHKSGTESRKRSDREGAMATPNNHAFIDSQNLHLATIKADEPWKIDMGRFRVYLREKYHVSQAYCFLGAYDDRHSEMYEAFQRHGYILMFREHSKTLKGKKKGNVDADIVFEVMREMLEEEEFDRVVVVSGDGDYKRMIDYLVKINRFEKILLPNKVYASSLYKQLSSRYYDYLDNPALRTKLGLREK